ncbi:MAG: mannonate dehydratase [Clostridia bacterium]|nr:mannonate dehydratase [Clostridia bacterium]
MKMTFRWYGEKDSIPLQYIKQIPDMSGVVTAVYDTLAGEAWSENSVRRLKSLCTSAGLEMEVIESVPVHEDIKAGGCKRYYYIENYCKNIRLLSQYGVKCICYNFMPVFDWVRTNLKTKNADGSTSLSYDHRNILKLNPGSLSLPGWDESYTKEQLKGLMEMYKNISREKLFENLVYFLKKIIPVCEECGINMAVHPDDPPWDIFGLPRIVSTEKDLDWLFSAVPSKRNGLTFCTGSLGAGMFNDLSHMAEKYSRQGRVHFAHLRNIRYIGESSFSETAHPTNCGSLDMYGIVKALVDNGFDGYVRPDHGRNIWGEKGKPGYGLFDRALGAVYLNGLFEAAEKKKLK